MTATAQYLEIVQKHRQFTPLLASLADFTCTAGDVADPEVVVTHPDISLYCLDEPQTRAIFVELPAGTDLRATPFVYQTQYERAHRLIAVPYDTFRALAHTLPPLERLIMIYSLGRSGSTLLSHLLNSVSGVVSLSEPDVATQVVALRRMPAYARDEAALRALLEGAVRFLFKPATVGARSVGALKLRAQGLQALDLYQATFPGVTNLYLYRDALSFVASFTRIVRRLGGPESVPVAQALAQGGQYNEQDFTPLAAYLDAGTTHLSIPQQFAVMWLAHLQTYLAQYATGLPVLAIRYDDLTAHPEAVAAAIMRYCGLPVPDAAHLHDIFARDAQAGTSLARDDAAQGNHLRLTAEEREAVVRIVRRHPVIASPDLHRPGDPAAHSAGNPFTHTCSRRLDGEWLTDGDIGVFSRVNTPTGRLRAAINRPAGHCKYVSTHYWPIVLRL